MYEVIQQLREKYNALSRAFDIDALKKELAELEVQISNPDLWSDPDRAKVVQKRRSDCQEIIALFSGLDRDLSDSEEFAPLAEQGDEDVALEINTKLSKIQKALSDIEFRQMLGGELDKNSAILSINSGAGGTEAQDWVAMLLRMYMRWAEKNEYRVTMIDVLHGEAAGYKNVTVEVEGDHAYGYLKAEQGIHRLVRISPFDANARRHTSFASVAILPELDDNIDVQIKDEDLRIDTYRAGGAGGQHINKTDSAVRITHIPSGIVVACQNERSQHKNKAQAMKVLKARLYERERLEREKKKTQLGGEKKEIGFGSQIRSYTLQPYQLIKDHRTGFESGNVQAVLDGQIDEFIRSYLLSIAT